MTPKLTESAAEALAIRRERQAFEAKRAAARRFARVVMMASVSAEGSNAVTLTVAGGRSPVFTVVVKAMCKDSPVLAQLEILAEELQQVGVEPAIRGDVRTWEVGPFLVDGDLQELDASRPKAATAKT